MLRKALKQFFQNDKFYIFGFFVLSLIVLLGIVTRFLWLDKIPVGITHDDADVVLSAKSFWEMGTDISGTKFPTSLFFNKTSGKISGLPSFILAPLLGLFSLNLLTVHFVYIVINLLTIFFIAIISYQFFKNKKIAVFVFVAGLLNPWLFIYSRYPTEAPFALLFAVVAIYFAFKENPTNIFWSTMFFVLSFYSYFGAKVVVPIIYPITLGLRFLEKRENLKSYILPVLVFLVMVVGYFVVVVGSPQSTFRQRASGEFVFSDMGIYQTGVDEMRRASIEFPAKNIFFNKYTILFKDMSSKYVGWTSPDFLFNAGDSVSVYRLGEHGLFYFVDIIFVLSGILYISSQKNNKSKIFAFLLLSLVAVAPLGSALSRVGSSYFFRSFLLIPVSILLIGSGFYFFYTKFSKLRFFWMVVVLLIVSYILLFLNFAAFYFFRYPVRDQDNQFLEGRILTSYIERSNSYGKTFVFAGDTLSTYHLYLFYNGFKNAEAIPYTAQFSDISLKDIYFTNNCDFITGPHDISIFETKLNCPKKSQNYLIIQNQKDAGSQFIIYNDKVCSNSNIEFYRRDHKLSDFNVESMSNDEFCNRWIFKDERKK